MKKRLVLTVLICLVFFCGAFYSYAQAQTDEAGAKGRKLPPARLSKKAIELLNAGNWTEAIEELTEMFETTGSDPNLKYYLAMCYSRLGQDAFMENNFREAVTHFENGLIYTNDEPSLYFGLGFSCFKLSEYSRAENALTEVLALNPDHFPALKVLGEVYYLSDEPEKAIHFWERAVKLNEKDEALKNRLTNLKKQLKLSRDFDTEVDNIFTVTFDGERDPRLRENIISTLEDIYDKIGDRLNLYPKRRITVVLLTKESFFDITGSPGWSGGVYEGQIKLPVENYKPEPLKIILCHEYVHAVIYDMLSNRCPWWLNEGLAQYFSGDHKGNALKLNLALKILSKDNPPSLKALPGDIQGDTNKALQAYSLALAAVGYMIEYFDVYQVQSILELMGEGQSFDTAIRNTTGYSFKEFETNWINSLKGG
jgi:tetratricopeptide (TPR) repeat protein